MKLTSLFRTALIFTLFISPPLLCANTTPTDSLKTLLKTEKDANKRSELYIYLGDLHPDTLSYWKDAMKEAIKAKNDHVLRIALSTLLYAEPKKHDYYLDIAKKRLKDPGKDLFISYLHCLNIWVRLSMEKDMSGIIGKELERIKHQAKPMKTEMEIEWEFITALNIDCSTVSDNFGADITSAIPHVEHAIQLLQQYPLGLRYNFEMLCHQKLVNLYTANGNKEIARKALGEVKILSSLYNQYRTWSNTILKRPFYDEDSFYLTIYCLPLYMNTVTKEEVEQYYRKYMAIIERKPELKKQEQEMIYDLQSCYYARIGDYQKAIVSLDSTIAYRKRNRRPVDLIAPLYSKMEYCAKTGDFENALQSLLLADSLQKEVKMEEARKNTDEMQARFNVNKLELEKVQLIARTRLFVLYAIAGFLICLIAWITHLVYTMRKLAMTQKALLASRTEIIHQKEKIAASEEMKTCFIQSMCHEIRTPLNAINGFSKLLLDKSVSAEEKTTFPNIIQKNTEGLTNIIDNMLEMSILITSNEKLPTEETCTCRLCSDAMQKRRYSVPDDSGLTFNLDMEQKCSIRTNHKYLSKVIEQLLDNAVKFTQHGAITLSCCPHKEQRLMVIAVTDTGIGIAPDKQEWIFERFTKLDSFKPGIGVGLYLCRIIITRLSGKIYIDKEYTKGCRMVIELPL